MRGRQEGFSLLEVVAAVLLLAITFTALMKVAGSSINLTTNAAERSQAAMWARSLLDSAFVLEPIHPGSSSGRFDRQFHWQLDVAPWAMSDKPGPSAPLRAYRLDLAVLWSSGGHQHVAHFTTLRLGGPTDQGGSPP